MHYISFMVDIYVTRFHISGSLINQRCGGLLFGLCSQTFWLFSIRNDTHHISQSISSEISEASYIAYFSANTFKAVKPKK